MELIIEPTELVTTVNGAPARLWKGRTPHGIACKVYVTVIAVHEAVDAREFEKELLALPTPREVTYRETLEAN